MLYLLDVTQAYEAQTTLCIFADKALAESLCAQANDYPEAPVSCIDAEKSDWYRNHPVVQFFERNNLKYIGEMPLWIILHRRDKDFEIVEVASFTGEDNEQQRSAG